MASSRLPLEEAIERLAAAAPPPATGERVGLLDACGRVAAETVTATRDQPPFDRSPYDGYAVRHGDLPATLPIVRRVYAGDAPGAIGPGEAAAVATGAPLPDGADCVVPLEEATADGERVAFPRAVARHANVSFRGEDVERGGLLVAAGERLAPGGVALLAAEGLDAARVYPRVRAAVLSTGSELVPPGAALDSGRIYDSNRFLVAALLTALRAEVVSARSEGDDPVGLADAMARDLAEADMLVTTGGVSVGERDCLPEAAARLGAETLFHGVDVKPGAPALAAAWRGKVILCLSGNPYAAFVTVVLLAGPVLRRLAGLAEWRSSREAGVLASPYPKAGGVRRFVPAWRAGEAVGFPAGDPGRRSARSLASCNCLLDIPADAGPLKAGTRVETVPI